MRSPDFRVDASDYRSLYESGHYSVCLHMLEQNNLGDEGFILRLRCLLRLGQWAEIVNASVTDRLERLVGPDQYVVTMLVATACHRNGMMGPAQAYMAEAYEIAGRLGLDESATRELRYFDALFKWSIHDYDACTALINGLVHAVEWQQKAYELLAWVALGRADMREHGRLLRLSLAAPKIDDQTFSVVLQAYTEFAREFYCPEDVEYIEKRMSEITWTEDLSSQHFYILEDIGWICALSGEALQAYEYYEKAQNVANGNPALVAIALFGKTLLALSRGQEQTAQRNLLQALSVTQRHSFTDSSTQRIALLYLAIGCARMGKAMEAQNCWDRYTSIKTSITTIKAFGLGDKRLRALEDYARGWVCRSQGDDAGARSLYKAAFRIWRDIGYTWRATLCAIELSEISGKVESLDVLDYAVTQTDRFFPRAWFSPQLDAHRRRMPNATLESLSPRKRAVALGMVRGAKYRDIAEQLDISENTVRNYVQDLFARFTPANHSRAALARSLRLLGVE